ncbi:MAG TPA: methylated-DNA--[protein]-cysteine S-methyltransferase [Myxococcota bacterium]|nr:methylated-DNA--[protein]-cysteine S-methyltransferase [Myxococcota bacterium]
MFNEYVDSPIGHLGIFADNDCILSIRLVGAAGHKERRNRVTADCRCQLEEYFGGNRGRFDLPVKLDGTDFQKSVWSYLLSIDYGSTCSYSEIADAIGRPGAQRAVGMANRLNCLPIIVPCHRVIGKNNQLVGYALGVERKEWLLRHEGARLV